MKHHGEALLGLGLMLASFLISHVSTGIGMITGLAIMVVWILKARKEWRHRDD